MFAPQEMGREIGEIGKIGTMHWCWRDCRILHPTAQLHGEHWGRGTWKGTDHEETGCERGERGDVMGLVVETVDIDGPFHTDRVGAYPCNSKAPGC